MGTKLDISWINKATEHLPFSRTDKMERLFVVLVMFTMCWASDPFQHKDLTGKMFIFGQVTKNAHVKLIPIGEILGSVSLCLRYFTDLQRNYVLLSGASRRHFNNLMLFKGVGELQFGIMDRVQVFKGLPHEPYVCVSVCGTWNSTNGISQVWTNGKPSLRKQGYRGSKIDGDLSIVLGQEQDNYGGGFAHSQSFVGHITDVHVWNKVLSPCEIQHFTDNVDYSPGDVINWGDLTYIVTGQVYVEDTQHPQLAKCNTS